MPTDKSLDLFRPQEPHIPGVSSERPKEGRSKAPGVIGPPPSVPVYQPSEKHLLWIALTLVLVLGAGFYGWRHWSAAKMDSATPTAMPPVAEPMEKPQAQAPAGLPVGPGPVARRAQLARTWSSKRFFFPDPITQQPTPAMLVRLPGGAFWAFSLREPFGKCELEYVTDLKRLQAQYDFTANHPMVGDPCNGSVFDLTRYGGGPNGLVRGEIEKGTALRPPMAIEIRTKGDEIIAVRMEE
jgi:hypothetical protein